MWRCTVLAADSIALPSGSAVRPRQQIADLCRMLATSPLRWAQTISTVATAASLTWCHRPGLVHHQFRPK